MSTEAYFHDGSGTVRFWVQLDQAPIGAMVRKETLHYRYHALVSNDDPLTTYRNNAAEIDEAVRRRAAAGSAEPILLRDADLAPRPAAGAGR
jgi:hypothetical protein